MILLRWLILCLTCGGALMSCGLNINPKNAERVSVDQLKAFVYGPTGYYSTVFVGVFYAGSDGDFDFVVIKHRDNIARILKVRRGELAITNRMKVEPERNWVDITKEFPFPPGDSPSAGDLGSGNRPKPR